MRRRFLLFLAGVGGMIAGLVVIAYTGGFRLNLTPSEPLGLWRIVALQRPIEVGDLVFICPPVTAPFEEARRRGYVRRGLCPGGFAPLIKTVAALPGQHVEIGANVTPEDPLRFKDSKRYKDRLAAAQKATGEKDALVALAGTLHGEAIVACAFEFAFLGGSMGSVVGERFHRSVEHCIAVRAPLVCFSATGGARMQEALLSLMQMAKTSAALARMAQARLPYVSVLTDPTTGGVSASLAMLGDINIGEPRALIGFAGPRVIAQTVRETLPEGFQRSEFLMEKGALDLIMDRRDQRDHIARLLRMLMKQPTLSPAAADA